MTTLKDLLQESERMFDEKFVKIGEFGVVQIPPEIVKPFLDQKLRSAYRAGELMGMSKIVGYTEHSSRCILSENEAGEPTADGGYRVKYRGEWYEARPVDRTPACECGLNDALHALREEDKGKV